VSEIHLIGITGEQHPGDWFDTLLKGCAAVVAGRRHRALVEGSGLEIIPVAPLPPMFSALEAALERGDVAVLASGDPLFFGIGKTLIKRFGRGCLRVRPALSSIQLACARLRQPWEDLFVLSLHGREGGYLPGMILGHARVMILTDRRYRPERIAGELLSGLRELGDGECLASLQAVVLENLGLTDERIVRGSLEEIAGGSFSPLNLMFLRQPWSRQGCRLGPGEEDLACSRGLITKDEVRGAALQRLRLPPDGVFWDVGAGSGSVAVAAGRLNPGLHVAAVECRGEELANIKKNIIRHRTYNVRPVAGRAPEALASLPDPHRVFVGGSGGKLKEIIRCCVSRLAAGGRLVVNSVLPRTAREAPRIMSELGLRVDMRTIAVTRRTYGRDEEEKMNPITIITGHK